MFCKNCGNEIAENEKYCSKCGTLVNSDSENVYGAGFSDLPTEPERPMKWYKFLIYFSLFAGAVINILSGLLTVVGLFTASEVYAAYPGTFMYDVFVALFAFAFAGLSIYTRQTLASYKKIGPKLLCALYVSTAVYAVAFGLLGAALTQGTVPFEVSDVSGAISNIVLAAINFVYFNKRKNMFVN